MDLLDFFKRMYEAPARMDAYDRLGPDYEHKMEQSRVEDEYTNWKRDADRQAEPLRVAQAKERLSQTMEYNEWQRSERSLKTQERELDDKAMETWGESEYGVPPGEDGPTADLETIKLNHKVAELERTAEKQGVEGEAAALRLRKLQGDLEDEETYESTYPVEQRAEDARESAGTQIEQQKLNLAQDQGKAPMFTAAGQTPPDPLESRQQADDFVESILQLPMDDIRNIGEQDQFTGTYMGEIAQTPEQEERAQGLLDMGTSAVGPAKIQMIMQRVTAQVGNDYSLKGDNPQTDTVLVAGFIAAMTSGVPHTEWSPELQAIGQQITILASLNPEYIEQISGGNLSLSK